MHANQTGRLAALLLLTFFGLVVLFPAIADRLSQPVERFWAKLSNSAENMVNGGCFQTPRYQIAWNCLWLDGCG